MLSVFDYASRLWPAVTTFFAARAFCLRTVIAPFCRQRV